MNAIDLYTLLDAAGDAAFVVDMTGEICFWSSKAAELLGFSRERAVGRQCADVLAGEDETGARVCRESCQVLELACTKGEISAYDLLVATGSGGRRWLNVSILVARVKSGPSPLIVHLMRDIEHRKRIEHATREILTQLGHLTGKQADEVLGKAAPDPPVHLTGKEISALRQLARGASTAEIAARLHMSPATLRNHIQHILTKLGCHNRLEAVLNAVRRGLI